MKRFFFVLCAGTLFLICSCSADEINESGSGSSRDETQQATAIPEIVEESISDYNSAINTGPSGVEADDNTILSPFVLLEISEGDPKLVNLADLDYPYIPLYISNNIVSGTMTELTTNAFFYNYEDDTFMQFKHYPLFLSNGKIAGISYYSQAGPEGRELLPPMKEDIFLLESDLSYSDVQLTFESSMFHDNPILLLGFGYTPYSDQYVVIYTEDTYYSNAIWEYPINIMFFDHDGLLVDKALPVPDLEVFLTRAGDSNFVYFEVLPYGNQLLIVGGNNHGEEKRNYGADRFHFILFDLDSRTYRFTDSEHAAQIIDDIDGISVYGYEGATTNHFGWYTEKELAAPPFTIQADEEEDTLLIVDTAGKELAALPANYYLVDWEPTSDGGYRVLFISDFNLDDTLTISEYGKYRIYCQPWDSRSDNRDED